MPQPLRSGDKIAIVALARKVFVEDIQYAMDTFQNWGLEVVLGKTIYANYHIFGGTDAERAADFQAMLDDPDIKAVISARGGYGSGRIIDQVHFDYFKQQPKWVIGFSDITLVLGRIQNLGIESIHGIMPALFPKPGSEDAIDSLRQALFGEEVDYPPLVPHPFNRCGEAQGILTGGNLSLLISSLGTPSEVDFKGKILFIEEVGEYLYSLDRMLVQLRRSGRLASLAGLVVGHLTEMQDNPEPFGFTAAEIIAEHTRGYDFPIAFGFPSGHEPANLALIPGRAATLSVSPTGSRLSYQSPA